MRRKFSTIIVVATAIALTAACSSKHSQNGDGPVHYADNGTFTMAIEADIGGFDPYHGGGNIPYLNLAYDTLVNTQGDGKVVSGLADKWQADTHSATFTLKPGVTCSDGTPLLASQVATDLRYVQDPKNQVPLKASLPPAPFTVSADDATRTVKVATASPFGFLLSTIGSGIPIVCAKALTDPASVKSASAGTGPFVLSSVIAGQSYTFTVRKGYAWGPDGASTTAAGTPAKLVLRVVSNETTAANLLLAGELNAAKVRGADRQRLDARGLAHQDVHPVESALWFNERAGRATSDPKVRRALIEALDLTQIVKVSTDGTGSAASGMMDIGPRVCPGDTVAGQLPAHDAQAAADLLDQAGWSKGADGVRSKQGKALKLSLHYYSIYGAPASATAELMAQQWHAIGAQVTVTADDRNALTRTLYATADFDVANIGSGYSLPSQLAPFVSGPATPQGQNFAGTDNPDYDRLAAQAGRTAGAASCALWGQAEQTLYQQLDVVPMSQNDIPTFLSKAQAKSGGFFSLAPTSLRMLR